jgi:ABC-type nitrate/sulfonate/bicarbonate transport system ATPase subunit
MQDEVIRLWQARGTTMVFVTHDIDEAIYMSDRIALMTPRPGRIDKLLEVAMPRPRLRTSPQFMEMRAAILEMLHFAGAPKDGRNENALDSGFRAGPDVGVRPYKPQ